MEAPKYDQDKYRPFSQNQVRSQGRTIKKPLLLIDQVLPGDENREDDFRHQTALHDTVQKWNVF
jgi:hypothetical protein